MAESAGASVLPPLDGWVARIAGESNPGHYRPDWLLLDLAAGLWLAYAFAVFRGHEGEAVLHFAFAFASVAVPVRWLFRSRGSAWSPLRRFGGVLLCPILLAAHAWITGGWTTVEVSWPAAWWLALSACLTGDLLRLVLAKLYRQPGRHSLGEVLRWMAFFGVAWWLGQPFYTHRPIGSGDAHWYTLMLSDYVLQIRAGVFPIWAGQTEYAFNGAVNPLRLAPWFQHFAGILDQMTARSLDFIALKNALITVNFLLLGGTAYACLRWLLAARALIALVLTLLLLTSPAVLAPLYTGDQYMTFFALPFACLAVTGLAGVLGSDRLPRYLPLCLGLAGLWLTHTPLAVWLCLLLGATYAMRLAFDRPAGWWWRLGLAFAAFVLLGTYPIVSALHLENTTALATEAIGGAAAEQIVALFPGCLLPLSPKLTAQTDYQLGYSLLAVALGAGMALIRRRSAPSLGLAYALGLVILLLLPVPAWADTLWRHLPVVLMQINGTGPHQRLMPIAALLIATLGALAWRDLPGPATRQARALLAGLALVALAWSGGQAAGFIRSGRTATGRGPNPALGFQTNNLSLTRYAFSSFATTPGYYTHGYINPLIEHRLLRADGSELLANAAAGASLPIGTRVAAGTFTAVNDNNTAHYNLAPRVWLPGMQQLLLKLEPLEPPARGWLQIVGEDVFREYLLPDSATGMLLSGPGRAFGTLPGNSPYVPLRTRRTHGEAPRLTVILPDIGIREPFPFARFELWQFDPARLPVAVRSWAPYRLHVNSPEPALVETPRVWQSGYHAELNGRRIPAQRTTDGLAMFPVPAGVSDLTIRYSPPGPVVASYWLTLGAWLLALVATACSLWRAADPQRTSAG